jgi:hypothetical protein
MAGSACYHPIESAATSMDNIRYQVFVSSTYADLKEERQAVIHTIIEANGIPAGMELFPAIDEAQLSFIKRVIDDCDYYLLIIGGRYGSVSEAGISFTEQEYDYAVSRGIKVIALLHENPDEIPLGKSEQNPQSREKLKQFRDKVSKGRLVKKWRRVEDLPGLVALSLLSTIREFPAIGWTRANKPASEKILVEVNELRKQNEKFKSALRELRPVPAVEHLAGLDETVALKGTYKSWNGRTYDNRSWQRDVTWQQVFSHISPYLVEHPVDSRVSEVLTNAVFPDAGEHTSSVALDDQLFKTIGVQLSALGLVKIEYTQSMRGSMGLFWSITAAGERLLLQLRTIKTGKA